MKYYDTFDSLFMGLLEALIVVLPCITVLVAIVGIGMAAQAAPVITILVTSMFCALWGYKAYNIYYSNLDDSYND